MNMYAMAIGEDPMAKAALKALHWPQLDENGEPPSGGVTPLDFGRLRDARFERSGDELRICVTTRNGGGNREEYQSSLDSLKLHPWWERDADDEFDSTYAFVWFHLPPEVVSEMMAYGLSAEMIHEGHTGMRELTDRAIARMSES